MPTPRHKKRASAGSSQSSKPNFLLIMTDQQRGDCLGIEGHPVLLTPNMDDLARRGVRFAHAYATCPSCIAARRSLLVGQFPATHGMVGYRDGVPWKPPTTIADAFAAGGYQTAWIGRGMHQCPEKARLGFAKAQDHHAYLRWLEARGPAESGGWFGGGVMHNDWTARPFHLEERFHATNWTLNQALEWLQRRDRKKPFFLVVSFIAPHPPLQPPAFYFERYLRTGVPNPVIGGWCERPAAPEAYPDGVSPKRIDLTGEALLSARAGYYGLINHVDDQLRRLLNPITGIQALTGNNTILAFTSDHGEMLGDHYCWRKQVPYEASARIPLLIQAPSRFGLRAGHVVEQHACLEDVMPTLLELAGLKIPATVEGRSLVKLLRGENPSWREFIPIEHAPSHQSLTDGREKFIWWVADGREQFFDLTADPQECHDLVRDPAASGRIAKWRQRLIHVLEHRPEGFSDGRRLIPGRPYPAVLAAATGK